MTTKDNALRMAIERLEKSNFELQGIGNYSCQIYNDKTIETCKAALSDETFTLPDGWVSVRDRLPKNCVDVLCFFINNTLSIHQKVMCINADGEWQGEDDFIPRGEDVTHWMPLPAAPTCEKEKG